MIELRRSRSKSRMDSAAVDRAIEAGRRRVLVGGLRAAAASTSSSTSSRRQLDSRVFEALQGGHRLAPAPPTPCWAGVSSADLVPEICGRVIAG